MSSTNAAGQAMPGPRPRGESQGEGIVGDPLLVRNRGAARAAGVPYSTWRSLVRRGIAPRPIKLGRTPYWSLAMLERWTAAGCPPVELFERGTRGGGR